MVRDWWLMPISHPSSHHQDDEAPKAMDHGCVELRLVSATEMTDDPWLGEM